MEKFRYTAFEVTENASKIEEMADRITRRAVSRPWRKIARIEEGKGKRKRSWGSGFDSQG